MSLGNLGNSDKQGLRDKPRNSEETATVHPQIEDHAARARAAMATFRAVHGDFNDFGDEFTDPWFVAAPDGWDYNWKTRSVWNREYPDYYARCLHNGWQPVPAARHREKLHPGYTGENIEKDGMILMERPLELTNWFFERDKKRASEQVKSSEVRLRDAPPGTAPRDQHIRTFPRVGHSVGPANIPD